MSSNANAIAQKAALEAITGPQESVELMRQQFEKRCDYILKEKKKFLIFQLLSRKVLSIFLLIFQVLAAKNTKVQR